MHPQLPAPDAPLAPAAIPALTPSLRSDGWTAERQRAFLEAVADGVTVEAAARHVGLSAASAYAFRRRPAGAAFALGWRAAGLLAREHVADALLARAIDGQVERIVRPDGSVVERHRYDNRLAATLLARLDRQVEGEAPGDLAAARLVAGDFDAFLALVAADAGPARTGLFVAAHGDPAAALQPLAALARADAHLRAGGAGAGGTDAAGLDPAARARWSAEDWSRAEAAGLVALAPAPAETVASPQHPQHPVWQCEVRGEWRTSFPPPADRWCEEDGEYGDEGYSRALTPEEEDDLNASDRIARAIRAAEQGRVRDAWFAARRLPDTVTSGGFDPDASAGARDPAADPLDGHADASAQAGAPATARAPCTQGPAPAGAGGAPSPRRDEPHNLDQEAAARARRSGTYPAIRPLDAPTRH